VVVVVKTALVLKHHVMKTYAGAEIKLRAVLTSALDGGERSVSRVQSLYPPPPGKGSSIPIG